MPTGHPGDRSHYSYAGLVTKSDIAVGTGDAVSWVQHSLANFESAGVRGVPASFTMLEHQAGCRFDAPAPGSEPVYVNAGSIWTSRVYAITDRSIDSAVKSMIGQYRSDGEIVDRSDILGGTRDSMDALDLIVTDTSKPIHLVLAGGRMPLWNIHAFEGVTITGISLLGGHTVAVVGAGDDIPVTYMTDTQLEGCGISPAKRANEKWRINSGRRVALNGRFNTFDIWFSKNFGRMKEENTVFAQRTRHILIGDVPATLDARMAHRSLAGATVRVSPTTHVIAAEVRDYQKTKWDLAERKALAKVGMPLAALHTPR